MNKSKSILSFIFLLIPLFSFGIPVYEINVEVIPNQHKVEGTGKIYVNQDTKITFFKGNLTVFNENIKPVKIKNNLITFYIQKDKPLTFKFKGKFKEYSTSNLITKNFVYLTGIWYPSIEPLAIYKLSLKIPKDFTPITEYETFKKIDNIYHFQFNHPLDHLHVIASNDFHKNIKKSKVSIETYFFKGDTKFSNIYINQTQNFIKKYENLLTPFPYSRFAVVENLLPTGYSMPTFTLIGKQIVKLPFIIKTSLGHEILHQWFGNSVYIDYDKGNWAEGLTTYLADHRFAVEKGEGIPYRKNMIIQYMSYIKPNKEYPVIHFIEPSSKIDRVIGYNKSMMIFHMLKNEIREELFYQGLKNFIKEYNFKKASWEDIQRSFENISGKKLNWFFKQWLYKKGIPELKIKNAIIKVSKGKFLISFDIIQKNQPYIMHIPLKIKTVFGDYQKSVFLKKKEEHFQFYVENEPLKLVFDSDYDLFRKLTENEKPPVLYDFLGAEKVVFVVNKKNIEKYISLFNIFENSKQILPSEINYKMMKNNFVVFLDKTNPKIKEYFGKVNFKSDFHLIAKKNPWNTKKSVLLINSKDKYNVDMIIHKLKHYGKYSELIGKEGKIVKKYIAKTENGIVINLRKKSSGVYLPLLEDINTIINNLENERIVYVGEQHNKFSHHITQLDIIKGLYIKHKKLAIGMEMFQKPFQKYIDQYIEGKIDERTFLKKTEYFKRWGFDYNLYKPIIDYAKENKIPVIALNIPKEITKKVLRKGIDNLLNKEKKELPEEIDFSNIKYKERLKKIFFQHKSSNHMNFDYFYQAQVLWDETMADTIDKFLKKHPFYRMVVIAGNGHIAYKDSIPLRCFRRNGFSFKTILNDEDKDKEIGDYVVYPEKMEGELSPKLGILIEQKNGKIIVKKVLENSLAEKIGLKKGDIILKLNGFPIKNIYDLKLELYFLGINKKGTIVIKRKNQIKEIEINLEK